MQRAARCTAIGRSLLRGNIGRALSDAAAGVQRRIGGAHQPALDGSSAHGNAETAGARCGAAAQLPHQRQGASYGQREVRAGGCDGTRAGHAAVDAERKILRRFASSADASQRRRQSGPSVEVRRRVRGSGLRGPAPAALPQQHGRTGRLPGQLGRERRHELRAGASLPLVPHEVHGVRLPARRVHESRSVHADRRHQILLRRRRAGGAASLPLPAQRVADSAALERFLRRQFPAAKRFLSRTARPARRGQVKRQFPVARLRRWPRTSSSAAVTLRRLGSTVLSRCSRHGYQPTRSILMVSYDFFLASSNI